MDNGVRDDPIDCSHPPPSWAVPPESHVHSINLCNLSGTRTCNRFMRGNHLPYAATQGIKLAYTISWSSKKNHLLLFFWEIPAQFLIKFTKKFLIHLLLITKTSNLCLHMHGLTILISWNTHIYIYIYIYGETRWKIQGEKMSLYKQVIYYFPSRLKIIYLIIFSSKFFLSNFFSKVSIKIFGEKTIKYIIFHQYSK